VTFVPKPDGSTASEAAGFKLELAYPSGLVMPGSGQLPADPTDPATRVLLLDTDLYNGLVSVSDSDTALTTIVATSAPFSQSTELPLEQATFDCTAGDVFTAAQLTCTVDEESNKLGGAIDPSQFPGCTVSLSVAP
jgi:hypothetical protein